jgi:HEAT repeat protein
VSLDALIERLDDERASVRRLAAMDMKACLATGDRDAALGAMISRLERGESDEKTALGLIRALGTARHEPARPILRRLHDTRETPVRIAHAAILAHDEIEVAAR